MSFRDINQRTCIIYHKNCPDGFGAAWAAHKALGDYDVEYLPSQYGDPPPEMESNSKVFILDFSYSLPEVQKIAGKHRLTLLDHHRTAANELDGKVEGCRFDMERSGAVMAWEHFFPGMPVPTLLAYVQDRDLWQWQMTDSRAINEAIGTYPMEFSIWNALEARLERKEHSLSREGHAVIRKNTLTLEKLLENSFHRRVAGHEVPAVNSPVLTSELGEEMLQKYPEAPFCVIYADVPGGKTRYSLRSRPGFDVSEVARQMGGGGHPQAAGFTLNAGQDPNGIPG